MVRFLLAAALAALFVSDAPARERLFRRSRPVACAESPIPASEWHNYYGAPGAADALAEVNAARAARGLRPFVHDPLLARAAELAAGFRAANRIAGHTSNDFAFLPPGASASAAGCGALDPSWGWGTCCTYDGYTYAGAGFAYGADGKRYMHVFVR